MTPVSLSAASMLPSLPLKMTPTVSLRYGLPSATIVWLPLTGSINTILPRSCGPAFGSATKISPLQMYAVFPFEHVLTVKPTAHAVDDAKVNVRNTTVQHQAPMQINAASVRQNAIASLFALFFIRVIS